MIIHTDNAIWPNWFLDTGLGTRYITHLDGVRYRVLYRMEVGTKRGTIADKEIYSVIIERWERKQWIWWPISVVPVMSTVSEAMDEVITNFESYLILAVL